MGLIAWLIPPFYCLQVLDEIILGSGRVDESGLPASDSKEAGGVTCYSMVNVSSDISLYNHHHLTNLDH